MTAPPTPAPAERCDACDRAECQRASLHREHLEYPRGWSGWLQDWQLAEKHRLRVAKDEAAGACAAARVEWPARARAAEAELAELRAAKWEMIEAATERAVKAEALLEAVEKTFDRGLSAPRTPLIESIRDHLRGGK